MSRHVFKQPDWLRVSQPWKVLEELAECLPQNEQVRQIYAQLPESTPLSLDCEALFVGNSRAVRVVNRHWPVVDFPIYGNRGTNGIEVLFPWLRAMQWLRREKYCASWAIFRSSTM